MKNFTLFLLILLFPVKQDFKINFNFGKADNSETFQAKNQYLNTIDFSKYKFNTSDGKQTNITLEEEKIYILDFWYLECAPCVKDHEVIAEYIDTKKNKKIEVIGMSIDRSKSKWETYLKTHQYNWTNYNQFGFNETLYKNLEIQLFPTYIVVNSKGNILHKSNRFKHALSFVEEANLVTD
ncbi:TlpA family protein disulfide reductase [Winogradskyella helgolandensis]|uniref:TlpA family protein disulfide reductase n=1 Tax=Winogradskyella helgolandensis TaxID=2697010 RepID=UPI0015CDFC5B|nr:TlpA disulfide reductase family protein [Winogradskyella helgolandensis]